jgi:hypothetical protein
VIALEQSIRREYRRVSYEAADAPTLQFGRAINCFPFRIAEVDERFLA